MQPAADAPWLHHWFTQPRASFWGMQQHTLAQVEAAYAELVGSGHALAGVGEIEGRSAFVLECYDPARDVPRTRSIPRCRYARSTSCSSDDGMPESTR